MSQYSSMLPELPRPSFLDLGSNNLIPSFSTQNYDPSRGPSPLPPPQSANEPRNSSYPASPPPLSPPLPYPGSSQILPSRGPSPLLLPQSPNWQPWNSSRPASPNIPPAPHSAPLPYSGSAQIPYRQPSQPSATLQKSMASLSFSKPSNPPPSISPPPSSTGPPLLAPRPSVSNLLQALPIVQQPHHDPALKLAWSRDVLFLVNHAQNPSATDPILGAANITDPQLAHLAQIAVPIILELASPPPMLSPVPIYAAEAIYWRATLEQTGAFPDHIRQDSRAAFRDFESAAHSGYHAAWFRLGREYENYDDNTHARECFEWGVKYGIESCLYRLGMAHLLGQLDLPVSCDQGISLLNRAATLASLEVPQPAYVYALLLLSEFSGISLSPSALAQYIPAGSTPALEARIHLERAAYFHFPLAQFKLGHAYEFAQEPFPFDPMLSVHYYSLACQQGDTEADMALSKWFLCGAEGSFEKDEGLALSFAEKAAQKGLPSAMFAMGYYAEIGVGSPRNVNAAIKWYTKALDNGHTDAKERLDALSQPIARPLSRQEHDTMTEDKLVRRRSQAKERSDSLRKSKSRSASRILAPERGPDAQQIIENIRNSIMPPPQAPSPAQPLSPLTEEAVDAYPSPSLPTPMPQTPPLRASESPPGRPPTMFGTGVGPRPSAGSARPFANAHRWTNSRSSSASESPPSQNRHLPPSRSRPPSPGFERHSRLPSIVDGNGNVGLAGSFNPDAQVSLEPDSNSKRPLTFAEMGIYAKKPEDKECVIM